MSHLSLAAYLSQTRRLHDTTVKFEIWDTAGQERYHTLAPMYYRGAQAAIVVYSITDDTTFNRAKHWVKELQQMASPYMVMALAGNRDADPPGERMVKFEVITQHWLTRRFPVSIETEMLQWS